MAMGTTILVQHADLVHDIVYDFYGSRLATCASDHRISVQERASSPQDQDGQHDTNDTQEWVLNDFWKAHDASVLRLSWAHPEFGCLLASCSMDRSVRFWEQVEGEVRGDGRRWAERARLLEARGAVQDVAFAPNHLGLKIAAVSSEGILRIYEALDTVNLSHWTLMDDFEVSSYANKDLSSLDAQYALSWCPSKFFGSPSLAVTGGRDFTARLYRVDSHNKWSPFETLNGHSDLVTDIAWAPNLGRSYELIATACRDGHVRIFRIKEASEETLEERDKTLVGQGFAPTTMKSPNYRIDCIGDFADHDAPVWRVHWNITGTILNSSGDDGTVRLWRASFLEDWRCMTVISAEEAHGETKNALDR